MINMTIKPTARMLSRAYRAGQVEARAHKKSRAYGENPDAFWTSAFLAEAVQDWMDAKRAVLNESSLLAAVARKRHGEAKAKCELLAAPQGAEEEASASSYLADRRAAKRQSAAASQAARAAESAEAAEREARRALAFIDSVFRKWAQAYMDGVYSVDPALVELAKPYELSQQIVKSSVEALMSENDGTQELLLAAGIALGYGGPGASAALPDAIPASSTKTPETLTWKENEHV